MVFQPFRRCLDAFKQEFKANLSNGDDKVSGSDVTAGAAIHITIYSDIHELINNAVSA
jgi:hypothetical protein